MFDPDSSEGERGVDNLFRATDKSAVLGEFPMPGDPTEEDSKVGLAVHLHRAHPDVIGVFGHADETAAVQGDVEFARQVVEFIRVHDEVGEFVDEGHHIDEFVRVITRGGTGGEVAKVVRAAAPRFQPAVFETAE